MKKPRQKKKWYNNGIDEAMFVIDHQPEGYVIGRLPFSPETKLKSSESAKKRGPNNKGKKLSEQACKNMSEAKRKFLEANPEWESPTQFKQGQEPWNKGLTKDEDSRLAQLAESIKTARPKGYHYNEDIKSQKWTKEQNTRIQNSGSLENSYINAQQTAKETRNSHKLEDPDFNKKIQLKADETKIEKYGSLENYYKVALLNREQTIINNYGSLENYYKILSEKSIASKLKSGNLGNSISKAEDLFYERLLTIFKKEDIERQYNKDLRYPFLCDFYIKSKDLFIELNLYWTHGPHKFDPNSIEDLDRLAYIKSRQSTYKNARGAEIKNQFFLAEDVWTVRDPLKFKTAFINNLNYITLYNKEEIDDFFRRI